MKVRASRRRALSRSAAIAALLVFTALTAPATAATKHWSGRHGTVQIDEARGLYVLRIDGRKPGTVTVETANDEVLLDHIICHLARDRERFFSITAHGLVSALVGRSLEEVERSLILATLRQHHFNRTRTAEVLGISVRTIRNKLKSYREGGAVDAAANAEIVCLLRSPRGG